MPPPAPFLLMCEEHVGVVQTPQHFLNPDPIQTNLSMERVAQMNSAFFDVGTPSKDAWGGAFGAAILSAYPLRSPY